MANGGLAITWYGRRGNLRSLPSARATMIDSPKISAKVGRPARMGLYGDDAGAGSDQGRGKGSMSGPDVEDPFTG